MRKYAVLLAAICLASPAIALAQDDDAPPPEDSQDIQDDTSQADEPPPPDEPAEGEAEGEIDSADPGRF